MSLSESFSIVVHARNVNEHDGFHPYELEYSNIGGRVALSKDEDADNPLTRIDLKYSFYKGGYSDAHTYLNVKETTTEIKDLIRKAQIQHIKDLQKHSIFIS
mgnify:CR=1 FL=1